MSSASHHQHIGLFILFPWFKFVFRSELSYKHHRSSRRLSGTRLMQGKVVRSSPWWGWMVPKWRLHAHRSHQQSHYSTFLANAPSHGIVHGIRFTHACHSHAGEGRTGCTWSGECCHSEHCSCRDGGTERGCGRARATEYTTTVYRQLCDSYIYTSNWFNPFRWLKQINWLHNACLVWLRNLLPLRWCHKEPDFRW